MKEYPIIFSAPMVLALLSGRKTMTRRLARLGAPNSSPWRQITAGDRLWVRESLKADLMENFMTGERDARALVAYYAADDEECLGPGDFNLSWTWKRTSVPSIHMPRAFSRLTLVVTATRI